MMLLDLRNPHFCQIILQRYGINGRVNYVVTLQIYTLYIDAFYAICGLFLTKVGICMKMSHRHAQLFNTIL